MNTTKFEQVLIRHGLIERAAIEDPENYDQFDTLKRVRDACEELSDIEYKENRQRNIEHSEEMESKKRFQLGFNPNYRVR